jgi:hypothetical protein
VMPQRPVLARQSDVLQEESAAPILDELRRISALLMASQEQICARLATEVQQVRPEVHHVQTGQSKVCAEMRAELEKKVNTVELSEAQLRTQLWGTPEGLVQLEQKLDQKVGQVRAKLEKMQNEQEKKKGNDEGRLTMNDEERLKAWLRDRVEEFEQQREEKAAARLQERQQQNEGEKQGAPEELLAERMRQEFERQKRSQREFEKKIAETVDNLKQEYETKVTVVLEVCEQVVDLLQTYESQLKLAEQQPGPELDKET